MASWEHKGTSRVDDETTVSHYECSGCGAQADAERGDPVPCTRHTADALVARSVAAGGKEIREPWTDELDGALMDREDMDELDGEPGGKDICYRSTSGGWSVRLTGAT